jgi:hypothetical protein
MQPAFICGMKRLFTLAGCVLLAATGLCADNVTRLDKANVLPLAIDDHFQFRKTDLFLADPKFYKPTVNEVLNFERSRVNFKAVDGVDRALRYGNYFHFFWRASRQADLIVRLEYRQEQLGNYVQAKEIAYDHAKGSFETQFQVTGDDYQDDGKVTAWRAVLIEDGKIVALTQSFLWN